MLVNPFIIDCSLFFLVIILVVQLLVTLIPFISEQSFLGFSRFLKLDCLFALLSSLVDASSSFRPFFYKLFATSHESLTVEFGNSKTRMDQYSFKRRILSWNGWVKILYPPYLKQSMWLATLSLTLLELMLPFVFLFLNFKACGGV